MHIKSFLAALERSRRLKRGKVGLIDKRRTKASPVINIGFDP